MALFLAFVLFVGFSLIGAEEEGVSKNVVATVNGEKITSTELTQQAQISQIYQVMLMSVGRQLPQFAQFLLGTEQGKDFLNEYKVFVLDSLIEEKIKMQNAKNMGIEVSEEAVQEQLQKIVDNNKGIKDMADLESKLKENQSSLSAFKKRIEDSLLRQNLKDEVTKDVSISSEEAKKYYDEHKNEFKNQEGEVRPFEEAVGNVKAQLKSEKMNQQWQDWLSQTKEEADIEKYLSHIGIKRK